MKVKELIKELGKFNGEDTVYTEGCDCIGDTDKVIDCDEFFIDYRGYDGVIITRSEEGKAGV